jgi:hypothetical protein
LDNPGLRLRRDASGKIHWLIRSFSHLLICSLLFGFVQIAAAFDKKNGCT